MSGFRGWPDCEICGGSIASGIASVLEVSRDDAIEYRRLAFAASVDREIAKRDGEYADTLVASSSAGRAQWRWAHVGCFGRDEPQGYYIPIDRIDTYAKMLGWMEHLSEKSWFEHTDWYAAIRKAWVIHRG